MAAGGKRHRRERSAGGGRAKERRWIGDREPGRRRERESERGAAALGGRQAGVEPETAVGGGLAVPAALEGGGAGAGASGVAAWGKMGGVNVE